jgi:hypothetical protein
MTQHHENETHVLVERELAAVRHALLGAVRSMRTKELESLYVLVLFSSGQFVPEPGAVIPPILLAPGETDIVRVWGLVLDMVDREPGRLCALLKIFIDALRRETLTRAWERLLVMLEEDMVCVFLEEAGTELMCRGAHPLHPSDR